MSGYFQGKRNAEQAMAESFPDQGVSLRPGFIHGTRYLSGIGIPLGLIGEAHAFESLMLLCHVCILYKLWCFGMKSSLKSESFLPLIPYANCPESKVAIEPIRPYLQSYRLEHNYRGLW